MPLAGQADVLNHSHRSLTGQTMTQSVGDLSGAANPHVNHQSQASAVGQVGDGGPVCGTAGARMSRQKHHAVGMRPVGQGDPQAGCAGQPGGDAVDHACLDAGLTQTLQLLAATTKNEGVTAFEANHLFALAGFSDHELFNEGLGRGGAATALADLDHASRCWRQCSDGRADQVIDQHNAGRGNGLDGLEGEQLRVARAGTDQSA